MKKLPAIGLGLLAFLVVSTQIPATGDIIEQAKQYFTDEEIAQGQAFAWQRRWIFWANALAQLALLVYLVFTPLGKRIYLAVGSMVHGHWFSQLVLMLASYFVLSTAIGLPFRFAFYLLNDGWGMTNQSIGGWLRDYLVGQLVVGLAEGAGMLGLYAIIRYSPKLWWLYGGAGSMAFAFFLAYIHPDVIAPLFNDFTPITATEWKSAEPRIRAMGARVGISASSVYVADASKQSPASNAYYTGLGPTQRIVLYDTLLSKHSPDEVDTVIAHEMGHWWEQHIIKGILFFGIALTGGMYLLFRDLNSLVANGVLRRPSDPAGLYRVILLAQLAAAITLPIQNGASRIMERQADAIALDLSKKPAAFIEAEKNLAKLNKMNVAPSRWNVFLFASHPPVVERIQMGERWEKENRKK